MSAAAAGPKKQTGCANNALFLMPAMLLGLAAAPAFADDNITGTVASQTLGTGVNLTVESGGLISDTSSANGINVVGSPAGTITIGSGGEVTSTNHGIDMRIGYSSGAITVNGTINSTLRGMEILGTVDGGISNTGDVYGGGHGIEITNNGIVNANGSNQAIYNSGTIQGGTTFGDSSGVRFDAAQINGNIVNASGGTIKGGDYGVNLQDSTTLNGSILNTGSITGTALDGILVTGPSTISGSITNNGSIYGGENGITVQGASHTGNIDNSGTITGAATGVSINASTVGTITNNAGGKISGTSYAVNITSPASSVTFNNYGELDGAIKIQDTILNLDSGTVAAGTIGGAGGIVNINTGLSTTSDYGVADGALSQINIASGRTFSAMANNTFAATTFTNNGTFGIKSGNTVTASGNYTQSSSGTLSIGATSASNYGKLSISGTGTFASGTGIYVNVANSNTLKNGESLLSVVSAGTLDASTFSVTDNNALVDFTSQITGNQVNLVAHVATLQQIVNRQGNAAAGGAGGALDQIIAGNPGGDMNNVVNTLTSLGSQQAVSKAVSQTLPVLTGGSTTAIMQTMDTTSQIIQARQEENLGLSSGDDFVTSNQWWFKPFGTWSNQSDKNGVTGFGADTFGMIGGADGVVSDNWRLGAAFAYANSNINSNDGLNGLDVNSYQGILYGSYRIDPKTEINLQADSGVNANDSSRTINFGGLDRIAKGNFDSYAFHLGAGIGHTYDVSDMLDDTTLTPSVRVDYGLIANDSYTETGADALNLHVNSQTTNQFIPAIGAKLNHDFAKGVSGAVDAGLGYDTLNGRNSVTSTYVGGGPAFTTDGLTPSPWVVRTGLGLTYKPDDSYDMTLRYDREDRGGFDSQTASLKLRVPF
ncbi:MAG: autotransporter domain-containing protein [Alphaproteobacteria bacterium]|nr:autotransporter domain-containing protein [Alphaproteobacteria bacterium]